MIKKNRLASREIEGGFPGLGEGGGVLGEGGWCPRGTGGGGRWCPSIFNLVSLG